MAGLSLNNDFQPQKASHTQMPPNQPPFGNLPPQGAYPMANQPQLQQPQLQQPQLQQPQLQQPPLPNPILSHRPPQMNPKNNQLPFAPAPQLPSSNGAPSFHTGQANQFSPQVRKHSFMQDETMPNNNNFLSHQRKLHQLTHNNSNNNNICRHRIDHLL